MACQPDVILSAEVSSTTAEHLSADVEYVSLPVSAIARRERRLEAETYLTGGYGMRVQFQSAVDHQQLGELAKIWQPYRLKGVLVAPDHGLPFVTAAQVFDIRPVPRKWVAPAKTPDLQRRLVERG